MIHKQDLAAERREYKQDELNRSDLPEEPFELFGVWLEQMLQTDALDPNAMILATVDHQLQPFQRTVLLKQVDQRGFVFFTNLKSQKAIHIAQNAQVSLLFPWMELDRQVAITGTAELVSRQETQMYFNSRPKESQVASWVSKQSKVITSREELERDFLEYQAEYANKTLEAPSFWGGYRIKPRSIEFWQGRPFRLHDRFLFERQQSADHWHIERLAP